MSLLIAPSILSCDFLHMQSEIEMINRSQADWIHVDVMDGVFVPNISIGFPIIEAVSKVATKPLDVHLMIVDPQKFIDRLSELGVYMVTVHVEAVCHLHRVIQQIKQAGMKAGVSLNPHTSLTAIENVLTDLDMVLLMSVNPGFGGQQFIPNALTKVAELRKMIEASSSQALIEVDGGVNQETAIQLQNAGADVLVAGNYLFNAPDPLARIALLKQL